jgi:hypothetical protein
MRLPWTRKRKRPAYEIWNELHKSHESIFTKDPYGSIVTECLSQMIPEQIETRPTVLLLPLSSSNCEPPSVQWVSASMNWTDSANAEGREAEMTGLNDYDLIAIVRRCLLEDKRLLLDARTRSFANRSMIGDALARTQRLPPWRAEMLVRLALEEFDEGEQRGVNDDV